MTSNQHVIDILRSHGLSAGTAFFIATVKKGGEFTTSGVHVSEFACLREIPDREYSIREGIVSSGESSMDRSYGVIVRRVK